MKQIVGHVKSYIIQYCPPRLWTNLYIMHSGAVKWIETRVYDVRRWVKYKLGTNTPKYILRPLTYAIKYIFKINYNTLLITQNTY